MGEHVWTAVDEYVEGVLHPSDAILTATLEDSETAGLPRINVSASQGVMLQLLATMRQARSILEIGTLGGYSTIYLARALPPDGRLITLEASATHAQVARANIARAGFADIVDVREGDALATLPRLQAEGTEPFDFIFLDANKDAYPAYLKWSLKLSAPGTVVVADNVVRRGAVADAASEDPNVRGVRRFLELVAAEPRLTATVVQTVGSKGYDGFAIAVVT